MAYKYTQLTPFVYGWPTILVFAVLGMVAAVLLSFLRPLDYSSTTRILITLSSGTTDPYTASRSAQSVAEQLTYVVYTKDFYNKVLNSQFDIDQSYFPLDPARRINKWSKTVSVTVSRSSGFLTVTAYHPEVDQAEEIAKAVAYVLTNEGWHYVSGSNLSAQTVDDPVNSRYPVRPNLPVNALAGFFLGALGGITFILIQVERLKARHQLVHTDF
jgi:capsular polysaccharide biosynthesis protein